MNIDKTTAIASLEPNASFSVYAAPGSTKSHIPVSSSP